MGNAAGGEFSQTTRTAASVDISVELELPSVESRANQRPDGSWELQFDPGGLLFYEHEHHWQRAVEARRTAWAKSTVCRVEHTDDHGLKVGFAAKVQGIAELSVGATTATTATVSLGFCVEFFDQIAYTARSENLKDMLGRLEDSLKVAYQREARLTLQFAAGGGAVSTEQQQAVQNAVLVVEQKQEAFFRAKVQAELLTGCGDGAQERAREQAKALRQAESEQAQREHEAEAR